MKIIRVKDFNEMSEVASNIILDAVKKNPEVTLGLATGGSPVQLYANLVQDYKEHHTSYAGVKTYNLDEYIGLDKNHPETYYTFMHKNLFDHINIDPNNTHLPSGEIDPKQSVCDYRKALDAVDIDLQLLGIGVNGHIGFNEPGSKFDGLTDIVDLTDETIQSNSRYFDNDLSKVPTQAISMGIGTILDAKEILLIASGKNKAEAVKGLVEDEISESLPASALRNHPNVTIVIDEDAASLLTI